jgi:hypothetical protein
MFTLLTLKVRLASRLQRPLNIFRSSRYNKAFNLLKLLMLINSRTRVSRKASFWVHRLLLRCSLYRIRVSRMVSLAEYRFVYFTPKRPRLTLFFSTMTWVQVASMRLVWLSRRGFKEYVKWAWRVEENLCGVSGPMKTASVVYQIPVV